MASTKKQCTGREKDFARLMEEIGLGSIEAYRKAFSVKCEDKQTKQKARDLARSPRVREERARVRVELEKGKEVQNIIDTSGALDVERLREFAFRRLVEIRDDPTIKSATRLQAVKALKTLHDPSRDVNLIWRWIDMAWRYQKVHCPCCHESYALGKIKNPKLEEYRSQAELDAPEDFPDEDFPRREQIINMADKRLRPHAGQVKALAAPERHIVGQGAARAGKSYVMALFAMLAVMLPGVEIWVLARIYEDARSEVEYLRKFLRSLFYPYYDNLVREIEDKKSGELTFLTRWGSELKIRSAKSKGSITGRELELALVAEPGWVDGDLYEELRARMSSRLGRIIAFGTPKGTAGMIGRMVKMTGRDPKTGRIIRRTPEERLISNGSQWNVSMLVYNLSPTENPGYVQSELEAARQELTDAEYASEFQGLVDQIEGAKFIIPDSCLQKVPRHVFEHANYVLGIDQGPRNFGATLTAYNGKYIVPCYEFFNGDETTMKANLKKLYEVVPIWIRKLGGDPHCWKLTITDRDPQLTGIFDEMAEEGMQWPTEIALRHHNNVKIMENWRRETQEAVNNWSRQKRLIFHNSDEYSIDQDVLPGAALLHDQCQNAQDIPPNPEKESKADQNKGWIVNDAWRGDHVVDAWLFTMWTIASGQLLGPTFQDEKKSEDPWFEHKKGFEYAFAAAEQAELSGGRMPKGQQRVTFEGVFGRSRGPSPFFMPGHYRDES